MIPASETIKKDSEKFQEMKVYRCTFLLDNTQYTIEVYASSIEEAISFVKNKYFNMEVDILNIEELFYF